LLKWLVKPEEPGCHRYDILIQPSHKLIECLSNRLVNKIDSSMPMATIEPSTLSADIDNSKFFHNRDKLHYGLQSHKLIYGTMLGNSRLPCILSSILLSITGETYRALSVKYNNGCLPYHAVCKETGLW
jgi:hypothetical protein